MEVWITGVSERERELLSAERPGKEQNTRAGWRRVWVLLNKEERGQEGETGTRRICFCYHLQGEGERSKAEYNPAQRVKRGNFCLTS